MTKVMKLATVLAACLVASPVGAAGVPDLRDLAEQCRAGGGDPRVCRSLEQLGRGAAHVCRYPELADGACGQLDGREISSARIAAYELGWVHRALGLQSKLDEDRPLQDAFIPATHNSFNSAAYLPTLSGLDHNQVYALTDQLRMDMRGLELDVHWFPSLAADPADGGFAPILCHGQVVPAGPVPVHLGCTAERHLREGLAEIRAWLDANPDQFLLLYLENHLDGEAGHAAAARAIEEQLGDRVRKTPPGERCAAMPADASRADILAGGHQVLIVGNCGPGAWGDWVHERGPVWDETSSEAGDDYPGYPACAAAGGERIERHYDTKLIRRYEDSTWLSFMVDGKPSDMTLADTRGMVECGVNLTGFDQLEPEDPRLDAMVWSWAENEPAIDSALHCASARADGRFIATDCASSFPYACRKPDGGWAVTAASGAWSGGFSACANEVPGSSFAVPATGYENRLLSGARGTAPAWLDYARSGPDGEWTPGATTALP
ncbi:MAG: phosphatidylinositol-specific phospholipase C domain-containing protein [Candidatus Binatia bacterium]